MRVLLTSTDADPTPDTILVAPQDGRGDNFETLARDSYAAGFVAEADNEPLAEAVTLLAGGACVVRDAQDIADALTVADRGREIGERHMNGGRGHR